MSEAVQESQTQEEVAVAPGPAPVHFQFGDLYLNCGHCGADYALTTNVPGGIRFDLLTTDQHDLTLMCKACDTKIKLYFKDAANPPTDEETAIEGADISPVQEPAEAANENIDGAEQPQPENETAETVTEKEQINESVSKDSTSEV